MVIDRTMFAESMRALNNVDRGVVATVMLSSSLLLRNATVADVHGFRGCETAPF